MTITAAFSEAGRSRGGPATRRLFRIDEQTRVLALTSWQANPLCAPTVLVAHGLVGDANAGYIRGVTRKLVSAGFNVVRLNARNAHGTEALTPTLYHIGLTDDLRSVAETLHSEGHRRMYLVGFSMGANVALKLAAEYGPSRPEWLAGVVAISPPLDVAASSAAISQGLANGLYEQHFLISLKRLIVRKAKLYPDRYDARGVWRLRTLWDFDDRYIAPCFGFDGADDYYHHAGAGRLVHRIAAPTLVVHARDDTMIPFAPFERWRSARPREVMFMTPAHGGHVGFIGRGRACNRYWRDPDRFWCENRVVQFLHWLESQRS